MINRRSAAIAICQVDLWLDFGTTAAQRDLDIAWRGVDREPTPRAGDEARELERGRRGVAASRADDRWRGAAHQQPAGSSTGATINV
jgi:hypothetical protein